MSPIFPWFGGKNKIASKLVTYIPHHITYVEVFGGAGNLLLAKSPSKVEVYNDIDSAVVNLFRILRDPEAFERFYQKCQLTPYSREEYNEYRKTWRNHTDIEESVYRWYVVARQSFSAKHGSSWSFGKTENRVLRFKRGIEKLPDIVKRLNGVQIENDVWEKILPRYDSSESFFYLDPPYLPETRKCIGYEHEMSTNDHKDLVSYLKTIKGKVMLSGYPNSIYDDLGWRQITFSTICSAAAKTQATGLQGIGACKDTQKRTECIWMNYETNNFHNLNG